MDVLRVWDTAAEASDPLDAEMFGSQFLGKLSENGDAMTGFEPEPGLVLDLLAHAERTPTAALARTVSDDDRPPTDPARHPKALGGTG